MGLKTARICSIVVAAVFVSVGCGTRFQARNLVAETGSSSGRPYAPVITTPAPLPSTEPELRDYPNTENTGVPYGTTLKVSGGLTVIAPGTVIDALDIRGPLRIQADNVTVKRSKITANGFVQVQVMADLKGVVIEDCEINGTGAGNDGSIGIQGPGKFLRNNIYGMENGVAPDSGALVQDNYIHDLKASGSPQYDGVQIEGGVNNVMIYHNSVINMSAGNSAILIDNFFGPVSGVYVDANLLGGGLYTVDVDASTAGNPMSAISFTGNLFRAGTAGYTRFNGIRPAFTGNMDDTTGKPIP